MGWGSDSTPFQSLLDLTSVDNDICNLAKVIVTFSGPYSKDRLKTPGISNGPGATK